MEVGFHVPGSAAGEGRRRSDVVADGAGDDCVERGEVSQTHYHGGHGHKRRTLFSCAKIFCVHRSCLCPPWCYCAARDVCQHERRGCSAAPPARRNLAPRREHNGPRREQRPPRPAGDAPEGLHTQSNKPRDPTLIPTVLTVDVARRHHLGRSRLSAARSISRRPGRSKPLAVFEREFLIGVRLTLAPNGAQGAIDVPAHLRYQACDANLCYAPVTADLKWTLNVVAASAPLSSECRGDEALRSHRVRSRRKAERAGDGRSRGDGATAVRRRHRPGRSSITSPYSAAPAATSAQRTSSPSFATPRAACRTAACSRAAARLPFCSWCFSAAWRSISRRACCR